MDFVALAKWVLGLGFLVAALAWFLDLFSDWAQVDAFNAARVSDVFRIGSDLFGLVTGSAGFSAVGPVFAFVGVGVSVMLIFFLFTKLR